MDRNMLIKFIPKPSNNDVILYDTSLKNLIDVDVIDEYQKLLPVFNLSLLQFKGVKNNIESYKKLINETYLYKINWSEEDYLYHLQNEKRTYNNLFGPIKKIESNIEMLQKKIKMIDDKIEIQINKENREIEERKNNIDKRIDENVDKLMVFKELYSTLKIEREKIKKNLEENQEDFLMLQKIVEGISKGECRCQYCNSLLSNVSENSNFYKRTVKNVEKNKSELLRLQEKKLKNDEEILNCENNIKEINNELRNDSNFKDSEFNFYRKKSVEVLKLEAQRDKMLNDIDKMEKELKNNSQVKSKQFLELKDKIEKYELSLENLQKIKSLKSNLENQINEYNKMNIEIEEMTVKMKQYKQFLTIFYKIYEQKAADFCGKDFKFKIFEFNDYSLNEIFDIYYKNIIYENLSIPTRRKVNSMLEEKFVFYD